MSNPTYHEVMAATRKPLVWLHGEIKTPPFSSAARVEAGTLLRRLQEGERLTLPHSRSMSSVGPRFHELRVVDKDATWRIMYRIDADAILIAEVFKKTTRTTPQSVIEVCRTRAAKYDEAIAAAKKKGMGHGKE